MIVKQNCFNLGSVIGDVLVICPPSSCLTSSVSVFICKAILGSISAVFLHFLSLTMDLGSCSLQDRKLNLYQDNEQERGEQRYIRQH